METHTIKEGLAQALPNQPAEPTTPTTFSEQYRHIELTEKEQEQALYEARKKKFHDTEIKKYWEKVNNPPVYEMENMEAVRARIINIITKRSGRKVFETYPEYINAITSIAAWLCPPELRAGAESKLQSNKGLLLTGPVGCGKTELLQAIMLNQKQSFCCYTAPDLVRYAQNEGNYEIIDRIINNTYMAIADLRYGQKQCGVFVDDIGTENEVTIFGNRKNLVAELIIELYARCFKQGILFHATTNLNAAQLKEKYGDRITSRLREMVNVIAFPNDARDFRK